MLFRHHTRQTARGTKAPVRRTIRGALAACVMVLSAGAASAGQMIEILSTPGCGCCVAWQRHLEENGYQTALRKLPMTELGQRKTDLGLRDGQTSCHTGLIDRYVIEGHVPAREVSRLLAERPDAIGLTVPDMPYGSPGMGPAANADPYDVLLVRKDGSTEVFASYR